MLKQRLEEYFALRRDEMVADICRLVRIDSVKGEAESGKPFGSGPAAALETALDIARSMGFSAENREGYVGTVDFGPGERRLDILAHLDVVPAGEGWTVTGPFEPAEREGLLYGRGTADDKGPAVAALYAMRALKDLDVPLKGSVRLILGTDEESGSADIVHYYAAEPEAPMTFSPDAEYPVISIEKGRAHGTFTASWEEGRESPRLLSFLSGTRANVVPGTAAAAVAGMTAEEVRGMALAVSAETGVTFEIDPREEGVSISARGKSAHASQPGDGNNALTGLMTLLCRLPLTEDGASRRIRSLAEIFPHGESDGSSAGVALHHPESGGTTLALTVLRMADGWLEGQFDGRTAIGATRENTADVLTRRMADAEIRLDCRMRPEHYVPSDAPVVRELLKCYEQYTGRKGEPLAIGGGTYVHNLKNGVAFGCAMPGVDNRMHGADEFVIVDDLILSAEMFAQVIADLCGE